VHIDHGALQDVGRTALNRHVDRFAFGLAANLGIAVGQLGHETTAAEHRFHDAGAASVLEKIVNEFADRWKAGKIGVDEILGGLLGDADVFGESEGGLAVQQRVIDDLGAPPELVFAQPAGGAEHFQRRSIVDVLSLPKRID
jgi:hypothetical protein